MQVTIQVFDKDDPLIFNLQESTTMQQIKTLAAEKLNLSDHVQDMTLIFDQRIIIEDLTSISQLGYNTENKLILFLPRYIRTNNDNFNKSSYTIPQPNANQITQQLPQEKKLNEINYTYMYQPNNNSRQLIYSPLDQDSPHRSLFMKLYANITKVVNRERPFVNPWKSFLLENNTPLPDPLVQRNFEITSKLNENQIYFICDTLYTKKVTLARALDVLACASYDPDVARRMV